MPAENRPVRIAYLARTLYEQLQAQVYGDAAAAGFSDLRPAHSAVLRHLTSSGVRAVQLAERAQMTKQSMGYLIDDLTRLGYVAAEPDPADGRARLIRPTAKGEAAGRALERLSVAAETRLAQRIGAPALERLRDLLRRAGEAD